MGFMHAVHFVISNSVSFLCLLLCCRLHSKYGQAFLAALKHFASDKGVCVCGEAVFRTRAIGSRVCVCVCVCVSQ
jgi:hypothetical protein